MQQPQVKWRYVFLGLALFGGMPFLFGAMFLYWGIIAPRRAVDAAQDWMETPCEILKSRVITHQADDDGSHPSQTYAIDVRFKYKFDGREHVSKRFDFTEVDDGSEHWKREAVAGLPPGTKTVCFVNPKNPSEAVIRRDYRPITGGSLVFLWVVTVGLMLFGLIVTGLTLIYCMTGPLGRAFDRLLQR